MISFLINKLVVRLSQGPVILSRDHHDVSGTDSPFRETSNITDGSAYCADMAVQNFVGDGFRGATWISLHNGGGTGLFSLEKHIEEGLFKAGDELSTEDSDLC